MGVGLRAEVDPRPDVAPCWSPDGRRIAFGHPGGGGKTGAISLVSVLGGPAQTLAELPGLTPGFSWSPDGKWLAVARSRQAGASADDAAGIDGIFSVEGCHAGSITSVSNLNPSGSHSVNVRLDLSGVPRQCQYLRGVRRPGASTRRGRALRRHGDWCGPQGRARRSGEGAASGVAVPRSAI